MTAPTLDEQGRPLPPAAGTETGTLLGFLDYQRATFAWKCADLTDEQLRAELHPTDMTLAGILAHLATVEDWWCSTVVAEQPYPEQYYPAGATDPTWEWTSGAQLPGAELRTLWTDAVARSRAVVAAAVEQPDGLSSTHPVPRGEAVSLRWVLAHLIEEYARHNGHADLLREAIDGQTGE